MLRRRASRIGPCEAPQGSTPRSWTAPVDRGPGAWMAGRDAPIGKGLGGRGAPFAGTRSRQRPSHSVRAHLAMTAWRAADVKRPVAHGGAGRRPCQRDRHGGSRCDSQDRGQGQAAAHDGADLLRRRSGARLLAFAGRCHGRCRRGVEREYLAFAFLGVEPQEGQRREFGLQDRAAGADLHHQLAARLQMSG